jgi:hypothetical protein
MYFLKAALNFALSFLRIITLNFYTSIECTLKKKRVGWHLVYEDEAYSLYYYCVWMSVFENVPDY